MYESKINLFVTCCNFKLATQLDKYQIDYIIVGIKDFSTRFNNYFDLETLSNLKQSLKYSKLCVCLNNIYSEFDISGLEKLLVKLDELKVDLVMFSDFAVAQIVDEKKLNLELHYNPETLVTSYGQFDFYLENKINKVNIATELTLSEVKKICENKKQMFVTIKGFGLGFIMHSRWNMIDTFVDYANLEKAKFNSVEYLLIKEDERKYPNIIYQDHTGTQMLTGFYICCIKQINELKATNINGLIIDALFVHDDDKTLAYVVNAYKYALNHNLNQNQLNKLYHFIAQKVELDISPNFFGNHSDVLHTLKESNENDK
ncbi:MAG: U32 family peptidase [Malacoplasma sp.]|nr:U32 family peptidase [Malacoplasma sp.]